MTLRISQDRPGIIQGSLDPIIYMQHPQQLLSSQNTDPEKGNSDDSWSQGEDKFTSIQMGSVNSKNRSDQIHSGNRSHANWSDDESDADSSDHRDTVISVPAGISTNSSDDSSSDSAAMDATNAMTSSVSTNQTSITQTVNLTQRSDISRFSCLGTLLTLGSGCLGFGIYEFLASADLAPSIKIDGQDFSQEFHYFLGAWSMVLGLGATLASIHPCINPLWRTRPEASN